MARHKSKLARALNLKPHAYTLFRHLTAPLPISRHWLGFYPDIAPLPNRIDRISESVDYRIRLADPAYKPALDVLAVHNWDIVRPHIQHRDPFLVRRFVGIVRDVIVPGHTLTPVDPQTWCQIGFELSGRSNWNFAHPGAGIFSSRRIAEPAIVVPPFWNYWHLFLEHLLPLIQAARLRAWGDETLKVVTKSKRPPLIDAVIDGLREEGANLSVVEVGPRENLQIDRLLVAVNQCPNLERIYGLAEAIPTARRVFAAAYRERLHTTGVGPRLYISRRGTKLRQIVNEDEVIAGLKRLGFAVLESKWNNHPEQLAAFSGVEVIVGVHGAGMTNIIFSSPGTRVLEMFPNNHRKTSMLHLSAEHDLSHQPFFGSDEGHNQAFTVDVPRLLERVESLLR
ncbi:MAG: glycosyltransferase family 61 protein [Microvirga sp.]